MHTTGGCSLQYCSVADVAARKNNNSRENGKEGNGEKAHAATREEELKSEVETTWRTATVRPTITTEAREREGRKDEIEGSKAKRKEGKKEKHATKHTDADVCLSFALVFVCEYISNLPTPLRLCWTRNACALFLCMGLEMAEMTSRQTNAGDHAICHEQFVQFLLGSAKNTPPKTSAHYRKMARVRKLLPDQRPTLRTRAASFALYPHVFQHLIYALLMHTDTFCLHYKGEEHKALLPLWAIAQKRRRRKKKASTSPRSTNE